VDEGLTVMMKLKDAVHTWLRLQPKSFFADGIRKLVNFYTTCSKKVGDHVEK
jgi:hypothetical protein